MYQKRAILMVCSELTKLYIHFLCLKMTKNALFTNCEKFNGKIQRNYLFSEKIKVRLALIGQKHVYHESLSQ